MGDFVNYWQAFVPHPLRFHQNTTWICSDSFKASLTTLYTHRIIEFSKTVISNHILLGLWISKKKCQDVSLCKKVSAFWRKYYFSDRNAIKYLKSKIDFKNVFLRVFRHFDSQFYIFFEKLRLFYIRHVIFRLGFAKVHNGFFFIRTDANLCQKLETLLLHDFVSKVQSQYYKKLKSELKPREFLATADFAENYAFVV